MVDDQRIAIASILSDCEAGAREVQGVPWRPSRLASSTCLRHPIEQFQWSIACTRIC